jgi:hypothetical protein
VLDEQLPWASKLCFQRHRAANVLQGPRIWLLRLTIEGEEALREPHEEEEPEELPGLPLELDHAVADNAVHCGLDQQVWQLHEPLHRRILE